MSGKVVISSGAIPPANLVMPTNYPLEIINLGSAVSANHRTKKAYTGLAYSIRVAVIGGSYPYQFVLSNAPAGMTISATTGVITWTNPTATATDIVITVTDNAGATDTETWTITVGTSGFVFLDAAAGDDDTGAGTLVSPWKTLAKLKTSGGAGVITYFKSGTYDTTGLERTSTGTDWERVEWSQAAHSVCWLTYPGESPIIDFDYVIDVDPGALHRHTGADVYIDGFECQNWRIIAFQHVALSNRGATYRNLTMHNGGPGVDGSNAACIMTVQNYGSPAIGGVIQDCAFSSLTDVVSVKYYSQLKCLIADNTHTSIDCAAIELKAEVEQFTVRGNTFSTISDHAIGGNMHGASGVSNYDTYGEICYNLVLDAGTYALWVNQDSECGPIFSYRNTYIGSIWLYQIDVNDGPVTFENDVIINAEGANSPFPYFTWYAGGAASGTWTGTGDSGRVTVTDCLGGASGIVDTSGILTGAYTAYRGSHGHEVL